jgi:hypothetical protein
MRLGVLVFAAPAAVAALAVSGGSPSTASAASFLGPAFQARGAAPTPKPTATPAVYPLKPGDSFTYAYSQVATVTAGSTTSTTRSFKGVVTAVLSGLGTYNGVPAYALRTTGSTSTGNASLNHIDYVNLVSSGGHTQYVEYGYNYSDEIHYSSTVTEYDSTILTYATPFVNDVLPEEARWSSAEPIALKQTINDYDKTPQNSPNILSGTQTRAADGSYYASGMVYDVPETRLLRSNGTGYIIDGPSSGASEWAYGLPLMKSSHEVIPATESYAGKSATNFVPDWYPGGALPKSPLATASTSDLGAVKAPASCGKRAGVLATHLESTFSSLDPVEGNIITEVLDDYVVPGVGYICTLDAVVQKTYDTEYAGTLTSTTKTNTSQILTSEVLK